MFMTGDTIRVHVYDSEVHLHEVITPNYGKDLLIYEKDGVPGVDWVRKTDGETDFLPLDKLNNPLTSIYRVNPLPIDLDADEFARLYAPPEGEQIDNTEKLRRAMLRAMHKALAVIGDGEDGGTCNFDSPALDYAACGVKGKDAVRLIESLGLRCHLWKPFKNHRNEDGTMTHAPRYLVISGFQRGQGNCRSRMAEAFCTSMNTDGCETRMYYQMD